MIAENGLRLTMPARRDGSLLARWRRRVQHRAVLARLVETSPHLVDDLGLDPSDVAEEVRKPFWRA